MPIVNGIGPMGTTPRHFNSSQTTYPEAQPWNAFHALAAAREMTAVPFMILGQRVVLSGVHCKGKVLHARRNETSFGGGTWLMTHVDG
jgi:hypothetical protein